MVQEERDMIVVFPHAYHCGFNHGFNIAESTNFAMPRWVEYGKRFRGCLCGDKDKAVSVDMVVEKTLENYNMMFLLLFALYSFVFFMILI